MLLLGWSIGFLVVICSAVKNDSSIDLVKRLSPCGYSTCKYGGKCKPNGDDYTCKCPYPTGGKDCSEELQQCRFCVRIKKQVIYLLNEKILNFDASVKECKRLKLNMFMPKTEDEFISVKEYMGRHEVLFGQDGGGSHAFWIGAKRASDGAPFLRIDNKKKVSYFNWARGKADMKGNCMEMAGGEFDFNMDNDPCENAYLKEISNRWKYHPACSGTYEFFKNLD